MRVLARPLVTLDQALHFHQPVCSHGTRSGWGRGSQICGLHTTAQVSQKGKTMTVSEPLSPSRQLQERLTSAKQRHQVSAFPHGRPSASKCTVTSVMCL